jgi:hypothetical protein
MLYVDEHFLFAGGLFSLFLFRMSGFDFGTVVNVRSFTYGDHRIPVSLLLEGNLCHKNRRAIVTEQYREITSNELAAVSGGLPSQDKLGNNQIQTLMSNYNEASTTLASIEKTLHDANSTVIGKI